MFIFHVFSHTGKNIIRKLEKLLKKKPQKIMLKIYQLYICKLLISFKSVWT